MNIPTLCIDADQQKKLSKYVYLKLMNLGLIMDLLVILLRVSSSRLSLSGHFVNSWVRTPLCFPELLHFTVLCSSLSLPCLAYSLPLHQILSSWKKNVLLRAHNIILVYNKCSKTVSSIWVILSNFIFKIFTPEWHLFYQKNCTAEACEVSQKEWKLLGVASHFIWHPTGSAHFNSMHGCFVVLVITGSCLSPERARSSLHRSILKTR